MSRHSVNPIKMVSRAYEFALRKRLSSNPPADVAGWVVHVAEVARLLAEVTGGKDQFVVTVGILHDCLAYSECQAIDIEGRFGSQVATCVAELTLARDIPAETRPQLELARARELSCNARMVKLADLISTLIGLSREKVMPERVGKRVERLVDYVRIANVIRGANSTLSATFDRAFATALDHLTASLAGENGPETQRLMNRIAEVKRMPF